MGASGSTERKQTSLNGEGDAPEVYTSDIDMKERIFDEILSSIWIFTVMLKTLHANARRASESFKYIPMITLFNASAFTKMINAFRKNKRYFYDDEEHEENMIMATALELIGFVNTDQALDKNIEYALQYNIDANVWIKDTIPTAWTDKDAFYSAYKHRIPECLEHLERLARF